MADVEVGLVPDLRVFSASRLKAFVCPFRWERKYRQGIEEPSTEPLVLGKAIHTILQKAGEALKTRGVLPKRNEVSQWVAEEEAAANATGLLTKTAIGDIGRLARRGIKTLEDLPNPANLEVEFYFQVPIPGFPGFAFQGYVDLIVINGDVAILRDYKSSRKVYEIADDPSFQLPLYAWALSQVFPQIREWHLQLHFLRFGVTAYAVADDTMIAQAVQYLKGQTQAVQFALEAEDWPAMPGMQCVSCPAAAVCPAAAAPAVVDLSTPGGASRAFGSLLAIEAKYDQLREALRPYVDQHGVVQCGGEYLGYYGSASMVWEDLPKVISYLEQSGINPLEYLKADDAKLRKHADTDPDLLKLAVRKEGSRQFTHRSSPPEII